MVGHGILARMPTVMDCAGRYVGLVLWPARLSLDYSAPVLNLVRGVTPFLLLGLGATILLVWLAVRRRSTPEGFGAALAILTFALASNLPVVIGTIFAERLFYLPSAGILIVIASGGAALASRRIPANVLHVILAVTVVIGVGRTFARNRDYRDERTMYAAAARAMPKSPKMRYNNAVQLGKLGRPEDALREALEAIRLNPSSRECRGVIAASLDTLGRRDEAIRTLVKFLALDPKDHDSRVNLILLLEKDGAGARVDSVLEAGLVQDPECVEWIERSARRAQTRGDFVHAIPLWREAVRHIAESADDALNLAWCLLVTGDAGGAREAYRTALRLTPSSAVAANGLAWSILDCGGAAAEAVRLAEQATAAERNPSYLDTLARAYIATGRCAEAVRAAEEAIALEPDKAAYRERLEEARRCH
jgi:tetratricopeptide (TPR) repeat protein